MDEGMLCDKIYCKKKLQSKIKKLCYEKMLQK